MYGTSSQKTLRRFSFPEKILIVGDGCSGKTSLLSLHCLGYFPKYCIPSIFQDYVLDRRVGDNVVQLALWDVTGHDDYCQLRPVAYSNVHVILIAFSVDNLESLGNAMNKWTDEAAYYGHGAPIVLLGLKSDLRVLSEKPDTIRYGLNHISYQDGETAARDIGAKRYLECSSLNGEGIEDVFELAALMALQQSEKGNGLGRCFLQ